MSISKNVFGLALGALLVTGAETSLAASAPATGSNTTEEEVLFKIHDISPVKNSDGEVIACDFNATFYNRSPYEVSDAVVSLTWNDQSLENIIKSEKSEDAKKRNISSGRAYSETERKTAKTVNAEVELSNLSSYKQVTVNARVNTDRCFMLLQNVDFSIKNCSAKGGMAENKNNARRQNRNNPCARMFKFVAPQDAQYYLDFKEISLDEEKAIEDSQKQDQKNQTNSIYSKTVDTLDSVKSIISDIK